MELNIPLWADEDCVDTIAEAISKRINEIVVNMEENGLIPIAEGFYWDVFSYDDRFVILKYTHEIDSTERFFKRLPIITEI